jgi:hypothetical protein
MDAEIYGVDGAAKLKHLERNKASGRCLIEIQVQRLVIAPQNFFLGPREYAYGV